jgi:uncharacterized protein (DUF983 family)
MREKNRDNCPACGKGGVSSLAALFSSVQCKNCGAKLYLKVGFGPRFAFELIGGSIATLSLMAAFSGNNLLLSGLGFVVGSFLGLYPYFFAPLAVKETGAKS